MPKRHRLRPGRPFAIAVVLAVVGACSASGDDVADDVADDTVAPVAPTPATSAAPAAGDPAPPAAALFGALGDFVTAFDAVSGSGALPDGASADLAGATMTTGPLPSGGDGFVTADAIPSGIVGGTLDADGAVTAAFVFVDPLTAAAAPAVLSLIGAMNGTPAEFDQSAFAIEYRQLAIEAASRVDDQFWTPSTNGSGHSLVTTVVAGAAGSNNLIEVAVVPVGDEEAAKAAVRPMRNEVIGLLAG